MTRLLAICVGLTLLFSVLLTTIVLSQRRNFPNTGSLVFSMGHDSYDLFAIQPNQSFGENLHTLFMPGRIFDDRYVTGVDCAPDSKSLIFWYIYLYRYDLLKETLTRVTLGQGLSQASVWSPDGTRIAYIDNLADGQPREIMLIKADGSDKAQVTHNDAQETSLSWSPDGKRIAYTYILGAKQGLAVVDVDNGQAVALYEGTARLADASWSPDGTRIAFDMQQTGRSAIYTIRSDGGQPTRLTSADSENIAPRWSPDGALISYSSRSPGAHYELYVMNADGSNPYLVFPTIEDLDVFNQCWLSNATAAS